MKIVDFLTYSGVGGFYYDDQVAIRRGAKRTGGWYEGAPATEGFESVRMPAATLGIGLVLEDGTVHWGDAMSVQYAGVAGRDTPFSPDRYAAPLHEEWFPKFRGHDAEDFRENTGTATDLLRELGLTHTALEYGLSQALLGAASHSRGLTMAEVVCEKYGLLLRPEAVPLFAQCGEDRRDNVDKMIMKRVDVLPHGLINSHKLFGVAGTEFLEYVAWVRSRVKALGGADFEPVLHFDIYGLAGETFDYSLEKISAFLVRTAEIAAPYRVRIESPVICATQEEQMGTLRTLRGLLASAGGAIEIVADEWCNTLEDIDAFASAEACDMIQIKVPDLGSLENSIRAVVKCKNEGVGAYIGGSCTETEVSARASAHVAIATQPNMVLAKPGMGVDEGITVVRNEQTRAVADISLRSNQRGKQLF